MTQHQFKVGQKVKVVVGYDEDPDAVDGNPRIKSGQITTITSFDEIDCATGLPIWVQVEYITNLGSIRKWFIRAKCLAPVRKKVYV